jgi:hypothetical protein
MGTCTTENPPLDAKNRFIILSDGFALAEANLNHPHEPNNGIKRIVIPSRRPSLDGSLQTERQSNVALQSPHRQVFAKVLSGIRQSVLLPSGSPWRFFSYFFAAFF